MTRIFNRFYETRKRKILRNKLPLPEVVIWLRLRGVQLNGYKFRRQCSIGRFVVDFYCPRAKLAVEIDGESHSGADAREYDKDRAEFIESAGVKTIRFSNEQIYNDLNGALLEVLRHLKQSAISPNSSDGDKGNPLLTKEGSLPDSSREEGVVVT